MSVQQSDRFLIGRDGAVFRVAFADLQSALPQPVWGRVAADGTPARVQGASVERVEMGRYAVTLTAPQADVGYPMLITLEQSEGLDDYVVHYTSVTTAGFIVEVTEQDNSARAGVFRDTGFSFFIPASPSN